MRVAAGRISGTFLLESDVHEDERGWFTQVFGESELAAQGAEARFVRSALSHNRLAGTLRGLHFQREPHEDAKLVTCIAGAMFDVIADVRPDSPTHGQWEAFELTASNHRSVFIPRGVAHGFQTLVDETTVLYYIGAYYSRPAGSGIRWDDETLAIEWPLLPTVISEQDRNWGTLQS